jgi:secretion/DNA translocation related TadE-like protein
MSGCSRNEVRTAGDRGSATLWTVGGIAVLCLLAAVLLMVGGVTQTRHRVTAAADLAALAAAVYNPYGEQAACGQAAWVALRMRVHLTSCRLSGWDALVEVSAAAPGDVVRFGDVTAHSRAGPAEP